MGNLGSGYAYWYLDLGFSFICYYDPIEVLGTCDYNLYVTPTNGCATCACNKGTAISGSLLGGGCPPYVRATVPWYYDPDEGQYYCLPVALPLPSNSLCACEQHGPF
jgi:hypothetical protein